MNSEKPSDSQHPKSEARAESNKQSDKSAPEISSTTAQSQSTPSPHGYKTTCKKRDWIDKATLGLEGFGLFVLIVYTIFTGLMYSANKKAAEAARDAAKAAQDSVTQARESAHLDQRAWVAVTAVNGTKPEIGKIFTRHGD
jgi:hypothetical protein